MKVINRRSISVATLLAPRAGADDGAGACAQTLTTLGSFDTTNGANPVGTLTVVGSTLYGTTSQGGAYGYADGNGDGVVFGLPLAGGTPTPLASFDGTNGESPIGGLTPSADGSTLYGTASKGGESNFGTIFSVPVSGGAPTVLHSFSGSDGSLPESSLTLSPDGSTLYGANLTGGGNDGGGTVFSMPTAGGAQHPVRLRQHARRPPVWKPDSQRLDALWHDRRRGAEQPWDGVQHSGDRRHAHRLGFVQQHQRPRPRGGLDPRGFDALWHVQAWRCRRRRNHFQRSGDWRLRRRRFCRLTARTARCRTLAA